MSDARIKSLWRYPVKSLLGERCDSLELDKRGVVNDRVYAIIDEQGRLASGKNTRRFRRIDGMFSISAAITDQGVALTFPDGRVLDEKSPDINTRLTESLGVRVKLERDSASMYLDEGPVHIVTTSDLRSLRRLMPDAGIDERRFRANIVIDTAGPTSENALLGKMITIGDVKLEVCRPTERCRMITIEQSELQNNPTILKTVAQNFGLNFGVYANVQDTGTISLDDVVKIS